MPRARAPYVFVGALAFAGLGALAGCQLFAYIDAPSTGADAGADAGPDASLDGGGESRRDGGGDASGADVDGGVACDAARCDGPTVAVACENGIASSHTCDPERSVCVGGECLSFPSCRGPFPELPARDGGAGPVRGAGFDCGPTRDQNCCASLLVDDGTIVPDAAPPPASFRLDRYEVTVERFRHFLAAVRSGWTPDRGVDADGYPRAAWPAPASLNDTEAAVQTFYFDPGCQSSACNTATYSTTNVPLPINDVTYFDALAFCIWDGGRLPRDDEWRYAAHGGSLHLPLPWSATPGDLVLYADATLDCTNDPRLNRDLTQSCLIVDFDEVGTRSPRTRGRFGQMDFIGNVAEWTADPAPCPQADVCGDYGRAYVEGGSLRDAPQEAPATTDGYQQNVGREVRSDTLGIRCAR